MLLSASAVAMSFNPHTASILLLVIVVVLADDYLRRCFKHSQEENFIGISEAIEIDESKL